VADKYLDLVNGELTQREANQTSAGAPDAGKIPALGADGKLAASMLPASSGGDESLRSVLTGEALVAGDFVNYYDNGGTLECRKADASNGRPAHGFVESGYGAGVQADTYLWGVSSGHTGLTPGARVFLSSITPGAPTETPTTASGEQVQAIGTALSTTEINFVRSEPITLA